MDDYSGLDSIRVGSDFVTTMLSMTSIKADSDSSLNSEAYYARV